MSLVGLTVKRWPGIFFISEPFKRFPFLKGTRAAIITRGSCLYRYAFMKFIRTYILKKVLAPIAIIFFGAVASSAGSLQKVVIISIDALHPAALNAGTTPTIYGEMRQGAYTLDGQSTNPPLTLISHSAMLTGRSPDKSGKSDNQWQPGEPTIEGRTIFNSAKQNGFQAGFYYSTGR